MINSMTNNIGLLDKKANHAQWLARIKVSYHLWKGKFSLL